MKTNIIDATKINEAAICIKKGGLVVFPTETVYGLGADAFNDDAIDGIYIAKSRPQDNPLIVHISSMEQLNKLVKNISDDAKVLMDKFWPGPLTIIFEKSDLVSDKITAGLSTVAVRFPSNKIAQELISLSQTPIAAPSANLSGSPSPTKAEDVIDDLNGRVDYIIKDSQCEVGLESTVLDMSDNNCVILRPGAITLEMIKEYVGYVSLDKGLISADIVPKCPGLKYTHYSPKADVIVVQGTKENIKNYINSKLNSELDIGVLTYKGGTYKDAKLVLDAGDNMHDYAYNLFSHLRTFDKHNIKTIYVEFSLEDGMGLAVRNRLYKSAGHMIIEV